MSQDDLPPAAAAVYLTAALRNVLAGAQVQQVSVVSDRTTVLSRILRLRLTCDRPRDAAPGTVILKTGLPHTTSATWNGGRREVEFYARIAPKLPAGVVPRCYDAHWDEDSHAWHLLLEDLTDTHALATQWPLPPSQQQCETILTAHARLHAAWWDAPTHGLPAERWLDAEGFEQYRQRLERDFVPFADRLGDTLSPGRRALFSQFFDALPRLHARYETFRDLTIVQGDSHVWNCFLPRDGGSDVRLFDWDSWYLHVPALDLSYMLAIHWYPDRRQRMERPLLNHYHQALLAHGVTGYDRSALHHDYRWSVLMRLALPVSQAAWGIPPVIWWNNLERIMLAVDDWGCRELLG